MKKPPAPRAHPRTSVEADPHPKSSHREPRELAADAHGPTGPHPAQTRPVSDVNPARRIDAESASDTERRRVVKQSARKATEKAQHEVDTRAGAHPPDEPGGNGRRGGDTP